MTGSAITIVLLSDHAANKGVAQDAAQQASDWLQRTSGYATAVAGVEVFDVEPSIFPTAGEAAAISAGLGNAVAESAPTSTTEVAVTDGSAAVEAPPVVAATPTTDVPAPTTEEVSTPDPAAAVSPAADVTTTEPAATEPVEPQPEKTEAEKVVDLEAASAAAQVAEAAERSAEQAVEDGETQEVASADVQSVSGVLDNPAQPTA